jgi:hypothetical protein
MTASRTVVYVPVRNAASWCRKLDPPPGQDYVFSDNASTDGTAEVLRSRGFAVICQQEDLGRVGHWVACVRHFLESGREWMRFWFAGDRLLPASSQAVARACALDRDARLIVSDVHLDEESIGSRLHAREDSLCVWEPPKTCLQVALHGNWFGPPLAWTIHRDALRQGFDFGGLEWAADAWFMLGLASRNKVVYDPAPCGVFMSAKRRHFLAMKDSLRAELEENLLRVRAAEHWAERSGRKADDLLHRIESELCARLLWRRLQPGKTAREGWRRLSSSIPWTSLPSLVLAKLERKTTPPFPSPDSGGV